MFAELMPLLPTNKGMIIMTVAKVDDLHLRVSFHPAADDPKDKPLLPALAIEGMPAELDQPGINFAPLIEASKTINEQIAAKADQVKTEPPPAPANGNGNGKSTATPASVQRHKSGPKPKTQVQAPAPPPLVSPATAPVTPAVAQPAVPTQSAVPRFPTGDLRARLAALQNGGVA
jgi:hypothetical protein